jgi:hypothetical protein
MSLTARIEELEIEHNSIKKKLEALLSVVQRLVDHLDDDELSESAREALKLERKPVRGRPPRIPDKRLKAFRDELLVLVKALESRIHQAIRESSSAGELAQALKASCPEREGDLGFRHLIKYRNELWEFLIGDRYAGNVANVAYAMAGVPTLKPRSSFDRCSKLGLPDIYDSPY